MDLLIAPPEPRVLPTVAASTALLLLAGVVVAALARVERVVTAEGILRPRGDTVRTAVGSGGRVVRVPIRIGREVRIGPPAGAAPRRAGPGSAGAASRPGGRAGD